MRAGMGPTNAALLTLGVILLGTTAAVEGLCSSAWFQIGDMCYRKTDELMTHAEGVDFCLTLATDFGTGRLATFPKCDDFTKFADYLGLAAPAESNYWVGAKTDFLGDWYWETLEPLQQGVPFWAHSEVDGEGQNCAAMDRSYFFQLMDDYCETVKGVACMAPATDTKRSTETKEFEILNCPEETTQVGDHCYYFSHGHDHPWQEAVDRCQDDHHFKDQNDHDWDGELFSPSSCEEFTHVAHHLETESDLNSHYWVGGTDVTGYHEWAWVSGDPLPSGVPYWSYGEPSDDTNGKPRSRCTSMDANVNHYLAAHPCANKHRYICKMYMV